MRMKFLKACLKGDLDEIRKYFYYVDNSARVKGLCLSIRHQRNDILDFFCDNYITHLDIIFEKENLYRFCDNHEFINRVINNSRHPSYSLLGFLRYFLRNKKFEMFLKVANPNKIKEQIASLYNYAIEINSLEAFDFLYNYFNCESDYRSLSESLSSSNCLAAKDNSSKDLYKTFFERRKYNIEVIKSIFQKCIYNHFHDMINYILDNYEFDDSFLSYILSESVNYGCAECLEKLIKKGVDCNPLSNDLLKYCISKGYYKTFRVLLENGADFGSLEGKEIHLYEFSESFKILRDLNKVVTNVKIDGAVFIRNFRLNFDDLKFILDNYECPEYFIRRVFANRCEFGSLEQVDYFICKYPFLKNHISEGLCGAISSLSLDVLNYLIQINDNITDSVWEEVIKKGNCKGYEFLFKRFGHCSPSIFKKFIQSGKLENWSVVCYAIMNGMDINEIMPDFYSVYSDNASKFYDFLVFLFKEGYVLKMSKSKINKLIKAFNYPLIHSLFNSNCNNKKPKFINVMEFEC